MARVKNYSTCYSEKFANALVAGRMTINMNLTQVNEIVEALKKFKNGEE